MEFCTELLFTFWNMGLMLGLILLVLILLRPLTKRLLSPSQRVFLWGAIWIVGFMPQGMALAACIPVPFPTFLDWVVPRNSSTIYSALPAFLPDVRGAGTFHLALPGGALIPFRLSQGAVTALGGLAVAYFVFVLALAAWMDWRTRKLARSGCPLTQEDKERLGIGTVAESVTIRLCPDLPTSFVIGSLWKQEIALQKELPTQQMRLVLLHEWAHVRRCDPWLNALMMTACCLHCGNPIVWVAYHLTRRDIELACDRRVLGQLDEKDRREYARTLVELASSRPVWGGLTTFGECDAALRVREAVEWEPGQGRQTAKEILGWTAAVLLVLFLIAGGPKGKIPLEDILLDMEREEVWTLLERDMEEQGAPVDSGADCYIWGAGHTYVSLYFQDTEGGWWEAFFRRTPYKGFGLDVRLEAQDREPELEGAQRARWREIPG